MSAPTKHSVRMRVLSSPEVKTSNMPDFYVPRTILDALGVSDNCTLTLTFTDVGAEHQRSGN